MIKKEDLQIGNYINYEQTTHTVSELHTDKIIHYWNGGGSDGYVNGYDQINPIELSESGLLKFGFEHFKKNVSFNMNGELFDYWEKTYGEVNEFGVRPAFIIWTDRKMSFFSLKGILKSTERKYSYIHELQQFYKLYTGLNLRYED